MAEPVMLEVRERRGAFGRLVKWVFIAFQAVTILAMLATCAIFPEFGRFEDQDLALQSAAVTGLALAGLWLVWPVGTLLLGLLMLFTRGRKRLVPASSLATPVSHPSTGPSPGPSPGPAAAPRRGGSVPETGPRR